MKKFFLICLVLIMSVTNVTSAKYKGLPENERIKIAVDVINSSRYKELYPASKLEFYLGSKLLKKDLLNIVYSKNSDPEKIQDDDFDAEKISDVPKFSAKNIGEILIFDAIEIEPFKSIPQNFDREFYKELGADYVLSCEIIGIGAKKVKDSTLTNLFGLVGTGISCAGSGNKSSDKNLRNIGDGISMMSYLDMLDINTRTAIQIVVRMQLINVETGQIVYQENFIGQANKHHQPRKGYDNAWDQAYNESVEKSANQISNRINEFIYKNNIKNSKKIYS